MGALLGLSGIIDRMNEWIGKAMGWLILLAILVSAGNAVIRKVFSISSNAWLELQWYLFGAAFMLAAAYTLKQNEHVRIDVFYASRTRGRSTGSTCSAMSSSSCPSSLLMSWMLVPYAWRAYANGEISTNAGGLIIWPARALPGGGLHPAWSLQGFSEIVKKIAVMRGIIDDPTPHLDRQGTGRTGSAGAGAGDQVMMELIAQNMAPIMFASLVVFLLLGYPVAFSLAANGLIFFAIGVWLAPYVREHDHAGLAAALHHAAAIVGGDVERHAAGHPLLHLHGHHP